MVVMDKNRRTKSCKLPLPLIIAALATHLLVGLLAFQLGLSLSTCSKEIKECPPCPGPKPPIVKEKIVEKIVEKTSPFSFPDSLNKMFAGVARVPRAEFATTYDVGVPLDKTEKGNEDVMILYSHKSSLPSSSNHSEQDGTVPLYPSALDATQNCQVLKVILTEPKQQRHCLALVGQWESYHVHKFIRDETQSKDELKYVSRTHTTNGRYTRVPDNDKEYMPILLDYLQKYNDTLERLKPVAKQVANKHRTIIVMVCNKGQSELLWNFVCSARARNLDISRVLLFATDSETYKLATSMGLTAFDVQDAFGELPSEAARQYGDQRFTGMMMAKIYVVHLVNQLGYNLLFQDVDVQWYRNPLEFFETQKGFDIYFQDDGAHTNRYAPYSPNTGFYFVKHNARTAYLFSVFMRMGDLVQASGSHQSALNALLAEHASWRGLRVKILGRDDPVGQLFPGGFHYHRRADFMRSMIEGKTQPYIFHMSWTTNKDNKRKYYQQMNDWFLQDQCIDKTVDEIAGNNAAVEVGGLVNQCCSAEPLFQCHYRDKPSRKSCSDSPPIDAGGKSFW